MRRISVDRTELEILEIVSYTIEAFAEGATREASYTLADLLQSVDDSYFEDRAFGEMVRAAVLAAQRPSNPSPDWPRHAAITMSGLSRKLWQRILPKAAPQ